MSSGLLEGTRQLSGARPAGRHARRAGLRHRHDGRQQIPASLHRQTTAITLLSVGVLGQPAVARAFGAGTRSTGPESERGMQRRLDSIRGSVGFESERGDVLRDARVAAAACQGTPDDDLPAVSTSLSICRRSCLLLWLTRRRLRAAHWKWHRDSLRDRVSWPRPRGITGRCIERIWDFDWRRVTPVTVPLGGVTGGCRRRNTRFF